MISILKRITILICIFTCTADKSIGQNWILVHDVLIDKSKIININNERVLFFQTWGITGAPFIGCNDSAIFRTYKLNARTNNTFKPFDGFFDPIICTDFILTESCIFYRPKEFDVSNQDSNFAIKYFSRMAGVNCTPPELHSVVTNSGNSNNLKATVIRISPFNDNFIYSLINDSLYKTVNRGISWNYVPGTPGNLRDIILNPYDENYLYLITSQNSILISTDNGISFNHSGNNFSSSNTLFFKSSDTIVTFNGTDLYKSSDKGFNWSQLSSLPGNINCLEFHPSRKEIYYAGIGSVLYVSTNAGINFSVYNNSIPNFHIYGVFKARPELDSIYVVTERGLYLVYDQYITNIRQISTEVPDQYRLFDNFPNPFNPMTIIKYQCTVYNDVSLKVFDVLGNEVSTLVNEKQTAGSYSVSFDGSNFPSGVYFYKLEAGDFAETKRMVLIK